MLDDLFVHAANPPPPPIIAWRPRTLDIQEWRASSGPDYKAVYAWRMKRLAWFRADKTGERLRGAMAYYAMPEHAAEFIMDWLDTYDPRKRDGSPKWMPFVFFPRQREFIDFLNQCNAEQENGQVEKCRDVGATWLACAWSVWAWIFVPGVAIGWGSRKEDLVDQAGILDSIFEKIRTLIKRLPREFLPTGFNPGAKDAMPFMRILNPVNGASIAGESGDNIGRGGRKSIYFKDESAHYERPEKIEAALGDNTNVQIDISSVNGLGNVFHRRAQAAQTWLPDTPMERGRVRKFVFAWSDHPDKTPEWHAARKAKFRSEGLEHVFAQEVDRNYAASVSNTVIDIEWIEAAVDAHLKLADRFKTAEGKAIDITSGMVNAGLDVADGGIDRNSLAIRKGIVLRQSVEWGDRDVGVTTRRVFDELRGIPGVECQYDSVGMGSTVKAEYNRIIDVLTEGKTDYERAQIVAKLPKMVPWSAGAGVLDPHFHLIEDDENTPFNEDFFANLKAQAWWSLRLRFWRTYQMVTDPTVKYPFDTLISLSSTIPMLQQVKEELAQPTRGQHANNLKMIIDKKPDNTKSPNLADAIVMAYFPLPMDFAIVAQGTTGQ